MEPKLSEGQDRDTVMTEFNTLIHDGWELDDGKTGIRKTYHFGTYTKVLVGLSKLDRKRQPR